MIQSLWKSIIAFIIFAISLLIGGIPLYYKKFRTGTLTSLGNSFSGGVFLGISLLHLLPESSENLKQNIDFDFPLSYLLAIVGYMTILYIDKVAFDSHNLISHGDRHTDLGSHSHNKREDDEEKRIKHLLNMRIRFTQHIKTGQGKNCSKLCKEDLAQPLILKQNHKNTISVIVLATALSLHSFFEGMAIGLQRKEESLMNLSIAVLVHKIPESLALSLNFNRETLKLSSIVLAIFAISGPIGIITGMILQDMAGPVAQGIILSVSTGTFLYISASEILVEEFSVSKKKYYKYASCVFGITLISIILYLTHQ